MPSIIQQISVDAPVALNHPTWDFWLFTTDADAAAGNPMLWVGVRMDATAGEIADEIAADHLRSESYTADGDDSLRGQRVTIHLTAPDGTESEHPAVYS